MQHIDPGPRMSVAVVHNGLAFLAGQLDESGSGVTEQTQNVLAKIEAILAKAGSSKDKIVSATIWLTDIASFAEFNAVWDAWVPSPPPARATVESKLARPKCLIEISIVAAVDSASAT